MCLGSFVFQGENVQIRCVFLGGVIAKNIFLECAAEKRLPFHLVNSFDLISFDLIR